MAIYDHSEQEQLDAIKSWWHHYGNRVLNTLLFLSLLVLLGLGWNWYQRKQATEAADIFTVLQLAASKGDQHQVKKLAGNLITKFGGTTQAQLGAMIAARLMHADQDMKTAKAQLTWVIDNAEGELLDSARLNYAAVLLDDKAYAEALKVLSQAHGDAYNASFAQLRGDILAAEGKPEEARAAYEAAIAAMDASRDAIEAQWASEAEKANDTSLSNAADNASENPARQLLRRKLNALGPAG